MSGTRVAQSGNRKLERDTNHHRDDDRNSCDAIGAIPCCAITARAFIPKTVDRVRTYPSEDQWQGIKRRENRES